MLLHVVESPLPVDLAAHTLPDVERRGDGARLPPRAARLPEEVLLRVVRAEDERRTVCASPVRKVQPGPTPEPGDEPTHFAVVFDYSAKTKELQARLQVGMRVIRLQQQGMLRILAAMRLRITTILPLDDGVPRLPRLTAMVRTVLPSCSTVIFLLALSTFISNLSPILATISDTS